MNVTPTGCPARKFYGFQPHLSGLYIAAELFIALLAVIGNLLVCVAVTRNRKLRTVTNYFLVSLAVADILVGLLAIPCAVLTDLGRPHHDMPLCLLLLSILMVLMQSSILSLLAVAAERYVAILLPFQYQRIMSPRNARLALITTWGVALVSGSVPLIDWHREPAASGLCIFTCVVDMTNMVYFNFFCLLLLPLVVMFIMYGHIFLTVRRQLRRIAVVRGPVAVAGPEDGRAVGSGSTGTEDNVDGATVGTVREGTDMGTGRGTDDAGDGTGTGAGASRGTGAGASRGTGAGASRGTEAGASCGTGAAASRGTGAGASRGTGAGASRGTGEGASRGTGAEASHGTGAGASRGTGAAATCGTGAGASRGTGAGASRGTGVESGIGSAAENETNTVFTKSSSSSSGTVDPRPGRAGETKPPVRSGQELRTATSLFLVLFLFMVCWMPIHCINCVVLLCPHCPVPMSLSLAAILLSHANSALNPLLYAYRMRSFRHTLRGMCPWRIGPKHQ